MIDIWFVDNSFSSLAVTTTSVKKGLIRKKNNNNNNSSARTVNILVHVFAVLCKTATRNDKIQGSVENLGSVSIRECLDASTILATFTAGRTGLVIV